MGLLGISGCGFDFDPRLDPRTAPGTANPAAPPGSAYVDALVDAYWALAAEEAREGDWRDADLFARRAAEIAEGGPSDPALPESRDLPGDVLDAVAAARFRLVVAQDSGGRVFAPVETARAQTLFDCWLQELEEQRQQSDIDECRNRFELALRQVSELTSGDIFVLLENVDGSVGGITVTSGTGTVALDQAGQGTLSRPDAAAPRDPVGLDARTVDTLFGDAIAAQPEPPARFLLYFPAGNTALTPDSQAVLAEIEAEIDRRAPANVTVIGHTDTVGPAALNGRLAIGRANAVRDLLLDAGVAPERIDTTSFGESILLVETADNVDEPRNRRVEVVVR